MRKSISKIVVYALVLCLIVPCMFMLTACNTGHTHVLSKTDAKDATCTTAGNTSYYKCTDCSKYFSDDKAQVELAANAWVVPATGHTLVNGECACGYTDSSQSATTYTVTSSEWNAIFSTGLNNVTHNRLKESNLSSALIEHTFTVNATESAIRYVQHDEDNPGEFYCDIYMVKQGNVYYQIEKTGNVWYGEVISESVYNNHHGKSEFSEFIDKYSLFTYDSDNHCYSRHEGGVADTNYDYRIYIENEKLVKLEIFITYSTSNGYGQEYFNTTYTFSNHGTTTIDVPTWTLQS